MKKIFLAAALCTTAMAGSAPAFAQQAPPPPPPGHHVGPDANGDGIVTREEALAAADRMFARLDTNKDGQISPEEMNARHHRRGKHPMNPQARKAMLDRFDTDKDGTLSPEERQAARAAWAAKRAERKNARPDRTDARQERKAKHFARMDTDGNGMISQPEFRAAALKRFERADANHDGRIDKAEHDAMRARHKGHRAHRRGDMPPAPPAGAVPPPPPPGAPLPPPRLPRPRRLWGRWRCGRSAAARAAF